MNMTTRRMLRKLPRKNVRQMMICRMRRMMDVLESISITVLANLISPQPISSIIFCIEFCVLKQKLLFYLNR